MKQLIQITNKNILKLFLVASLLFIISACGDDSNPTDNDDDKNSSGTTLTINGDGWSNKSLTVETSVATYATVSQMTVVNVSFNEDVQMLIYVNGGKSGTYNFKEVESGQGNGITLTSGSGETGKYYFWKDNSGSVTISSYGSVGGKVSGAFTGKLYNATTDAEITITGTFNAMRTVDVPTSALN